MAKQAAVQTRQRIPVGGPRNILTFEGKDPDKVYRWVLDSPGRIIRFEQGGWEKVLVSDKTEVGQATVDRGTVVGSVVTRLGGAGQTLVLMSIRKEWFEEDQKAKQEQLDALEATMKQEAHEGHYGSLTITRKR